MIFLRKIQILKAKIMLSPLQIRAIAIITVDGKILYCIMQQEIFGGCFTRGEELCVLLSIIF